MKVYEGNAFEDIYKTILKDLMETGNENSPRGMKTKEFNEPVTIVVEDMRKYIIPSPARKPLLSFWYAEFIWMLNGSNELNHVATYLPQWKYFSDNNVTLNGAYGHRLLKWVTPENKIINQFDEVFWKLKTDINTRQAVMVMYNPALDFKPTKDVPCNDLIQFYVRDNKLCTTIYARSQDIINGTFYDIGVLSHFAQLLAGRLGLETGSHTHVCNSLHIYERDFQKAENIINENCPKIYDGSELLDFRISEEDYDFETSIICIAEKFIRQNAKKINISKIKCYLNAINNEAWRSVIAALAIVNLRKNGRKEEAKELYSDVKTEIASLIKARWL